MGAMILLQLIDLYSLIVVVAVVVSWLQLPFNNPIVQFLSALTEPALDPIRRVLPPAGGLDFSPLLLLVIIRLLRSFVAGAMF